MFFGHFWKRSKRGWKIIEWNTYMKNPHEGRSPENENSLKKVLRCFLDIFGSVQNGDGKSSSGTLI
jgi:hypothetical protein